MVNKGLKKVMFEYQAIPTKYNGVQYRSRLEARWALFFDILRIEYYYEHEGYQLPSGWYVPDFFLPRYGWFEIKAKRPNASEWRLANEMWNLLTHYGENFTNNPRGNFYILIGFPLEEVYDPSFSELDLEARTHEGNFWLENHDTGEIYFGLNLFYSRKQANNLYYIGSKYSTRDTHCCIHCLNSFEQCSLFDNKKISFIDKIFRFIDSITDEEKIIVVSQKETENIFDEALDKLTLIHHHFRSEHDAVRTECPHRKSKRINDAYEFAIKHRFY